MSATPQIRTALLENLTELHLPTMRACFEEAAQHAEKETLSYEQYLLELAERECEARRRNRIVKLLRESELPREKTLANFDHEAFTRQGRATAEDAIRWKFLGLQGESARVRESRSGKEPLAVRPRP